MTREKWTGGMAQAVAPALQAQSPKFKLQSHQKKKKIALSQVGDVSQ
jgi:hypothetical protein